MVDTVRSIPTETRITHDFSLIDHDGMELGLILCNSKGVPAQGGNPWSLRQSGAIRTSLQIRQGDADYSDYQLPYTPYTQKNWSGGRGNEDHEKDTTRYFDANVLDTKLGDIILAGKATTVPLLTTDTDYEPIVNDSTMKHAATLNLRYATPYTPVASGVFNSISVLVAPGAKTTVEVVDDNAGAPGTTIVAEAEVNVPALKLSTSASGAAFGEAQFGLNALGRGVNVANALDVVLVEVPIIGSLVGSTTYWIVVTTTVIGYNTLVGSSVFDEDGAWASLYADHSLYFNISTVIQGKVIYFEYKGALYAITHQDNGLQSKLFINGYRFTAAAGSTQNVIKVPATITLTLNELTGCVLQIIAGVGYTEAENYKKIASNTAGAGAEITLQGGFLNTPDSTTDIVILGHDLWTEIETTGIDNGVYDYVVANDIVYFCQGESYNIRRMREYNSAGTWTREFDDDGTNKASFMESLPSHDGKMRIWKFNNPVSGPPTAAYSAIKAWGTALDFITKPTELAATTDYPIIVGDPRSKITNVLGYGEPLIPYVLKEDELGSINNGVYAKLPINELAQVRSEVNGITAIQYGVYLFFNVLDGWERYYENRLDDVGPNRDEGLPAIRRGIVSSVVSYPGGMYLGIDAGATGYSSVLYWNQIGYHEEYRAPYGERIRGLHVQTIPGSNVGRLWIGLSYSTVWIPVTLNPRKQADYSYTGSGSLISSWFNGGFGEINKFWKSIQLYSEGLAAGQTITMEYQTDVNETWYALPSAFTQLPMEEVLMSTDYSVYGKRWRYRITMTTNDETKTPRIKAMTIPAVTRLPANKSWSVIVLADDAMVDHQGVKQSISAKELMDQLQTWADSESTPLPLTLRSPVSAFDNKRVFLEPPSVQPIEVVNKGTKTLKALVTLSMYEA